MDHFRTWQKDLQKKSEAGQDVRIDIMTGCELVQEGVKLARGKDTKKLEVFLQEIKNEADAEKAAALSGFRSICRRRCPL